MSILLLLATLAAAADLDVSGATTLTSSATFDTIRVQPGAVLTIDASAPVQLTADRVLVLPGGRIDLVGTGHQGTSGDGLGPSGGRAGGGGGGHVGDGQPNRVGNCLADAAGGLGLPAGADDAARFGSAGGGNGGDGAAGGGALTLVAPVVEIYGDIVADGRPATAFGGAGAGGSVVIEADTLTCHGRLSARGGDGELHGPGGGGFVVQRWDSAGTPCEADVRGGEELECDAPWGGDGFAFAGPFDFDGDGAVPDCAPDDPSRPGAEVCNGIDDDCNGLVDDGVVCGTCEAVEVDGTTYQVCRDPVDQPTAEAACEALAPGAYHLVTADDPGLLDALGVEEPTFWTGLVDAGGNDWRWASGESAWGHAWADEPTCGDHTPDGDGACALATAFPCGTRLDDVACGTPQPYVCEACQVQTFYADADGDGFGDLASPFQACHAEAVGLRVSAVAGDCDDSDAAIHPTAAEVCDGIDNDCDGWVDPMGLAFADDDLDGYGDPATPLVGTTCDEVPTGRADDGDCDDGNGLRHPGAAEVCALDGVGTDDDCDGLVDEDVCATCDHFVHDDQQFQVCTTLATWFTADANCALTGMELARTDDQADLNRLARGLADQGQTRGWIGLAEDLVLGWGWSDGTPLGTPWWATFEPSGDGDHGELWAGQNGYWAAWNDEPFTTPLPFVCARDCPSELRYADLDGDGFGAGAGQFVCVDLDGWVRRTGDCDDTDAAVHPGAYDRPGDTIDDDCTVLRSCFVDGDLDGFGSATIGFALACTDPGFAPTHDDCDDTDPAIHPAAPEVPGDDVDQDCDRRDLCYEDLDGDGFGVGLVDGDHDRCDGEGLARAGGDCDDTDPTIHPGGTEAPVDGIDGDCDGTDLCYEDLDADGYGELLVPGPLDPVTPCAGPFTTAFAGDCDDSRPDVYVGATEVVASGVDEDCDGLEQCPRDADLDGWGGAPEPTTDLSCTDIGWSPLAGDCDDGDPTAYPGAIEALADGVDSDCDGTERCFRDLDGDGVTAPSDQTVPSPDLTCSGPGLASVPGDDCDDDDDATYPGAPEVPTDGIDQDCDGVDACYLDDDRDGWGSRTLVPGDDCSLPGRADNDDDCNDGDPTIYPGAEEIPDSVIDQDCDSFELCPEDRDGDGYVGLHIGALGCDALGQQVLDCDDTEPSVFPGATEVPIDGIDQDCDGLEACLPDEDGDVFGADDGSTVPGNLDDPDTFCTDPGTTTLEGDCDDTRVEVNPGVPEVPCDGTDDDCDPTNDCLIDTSETGGLPGTDTGTGGLDTAPGLTDTGPGTAPTTGPSTAPTNPAGPAASAAAGQGCSCASSSGAAGVWVGLLAFALARRRR